MNVWHFPIENCLLIGNFNGFMYVWRAEWSIGVSQQTIKAYKCGLSGAFLVTRCSKLVKSDFGFFNLFIAKKNHLKKRHKMTRNLIIFVLCTMIVLANSRPQSERAPRPPRPIRPIHHHHHTHPEEIIQTTFDGVNAVISSSTNLATSTLDSLG